MNWEQKVWNGGRAVLWAIRPLLLYILLPGFCVIVGSILRRFRGTDNIWYTSGNFYQFIGALIYFYILYRIAEKKGTTISEETTLFYKGQDRELSILYLGLGFTSALVISALLTVLPLPGFLANNYTDMSQKVFFSPDLILVILNIGIAAPILEEIIFRGYMLNRMLRFFDEKKAVYITAALFALCHVNIIWILYSFVLGIILGRTAMKKDNIFYGILLHGGFNLFSVVNIILIVTGLGGKYFFSSKVLVAGYGIIGALGLSLIVRKLQGREEWYL